MALDDFNDVLFQQGTPFDQQVRSTGFRSPQSNPGISSGLGDPQAGLDDLFDFFGNIDETLERRRRQKRTILDLLGIVPGVGGGISILDMLAR